MAIQSPKGMSHYFIKKAIRIIPLYYICTFGVFLIGMFAPSLLQLVKPTFINLVKSLLFLPIYDSSVYSLPGALLPVGWAMVVEVFVYVLFWLSFKLMKSKPVKAVIFCVGILCVLAIIGLFTSDNVFSFSYCRLYMLYFAVGMALSLIPAGVLKKTNRSLSGKRIPSIFVVAGAGVSILIGLIYSENLAWITLDAVLFGAMILFLSESTFPKWVVKGGNMTYSFYLIHFFICKGFDRLIYHAVTIPGMIFTFVAAFIISVVVAYIFYNIIEEKLGGALRHVLIKDKT
ncbi:MAG: acyltransferase family protein [Saccharofermentanales bacterium]